jgi:hypothetical protein
MSNALFDSGRENFLDGNISWTNDTIRAVFVDHADDTPVVATDDYLNDIATAARVPSGTDGTQTNHSALASKTKTAGVADAADTTFTALTGDVVESLVIYRGTLTDTTSELIAYIDSATGLPLTPNGGDVIVSWDSGSSRIFKL